MNLTLDIGNTRTKVCVFKSNQIIHSLVCNDLDAEKTAFLLEDWSIVNSISSTVGTTNPKVIEILKNRTNHFELKNTLSLPIEIDYKTPHTLGKDRIATAVGALDFFPNKNCLVIDAGTCITLDLLDAQGIFRGGNISPGIEMRLRSVHAFTSSLPLVDKNKAHGLLGKSTEEAIANGSVMGAIYEIDSFIGHCQQKYEDLVILITGGDAKIFEDKLSSCLTLKSHLLDVGLNKILEHQL